MIYQFNKPRVQAVAVNDNQSAHELWRVRTVKRWAEDLAPAPMPVDPDPLG